MSDDIVTRLRAVDLPISCDHCRSLVIRNGDLEAEVRNLRDRCERLEDILRGAAPLIEGDEE
jgi:hypothetical protein